MARPTDPRDWPTEQLARQTAHPHPTWWTWAGNRPWVAAVITFAAAASVALVPNADVSVVIIPGVAGLSGLLLGILLAACALFLLFSPHLHVLIGIAIVLLSLTSFISSNLGGLLIGMLLGVVGGSLSFGWQPPSTLKA